MCDDHSADSDPCFTTLSDETIETDFDLDKDLELDLECDELSEHETESFSVLMNELNLEINHSAVFGVTELQGIISHELKTLMFNVLTESYQNLHLSEHFRPTVLQAIKEAETVDQDSQMDRVRMQQAELEQHLVSAGEEKGNVCTELQKQLCNQENIVQSLHLELRSSQHCIQALRENLHQAEDRVQALKLELNEKQEKIHLLNQNLINAHESTKFIQMDLDVSKDLSYRLQQKLSDTEEQNRALQEELTACRARVQEAEKEKQQEIESKEECKSKIRNMFNILKGLNNWLELAMGDLQGQLKMALEREESLRKTVKETTVKHKTEVEQLQHSLSKSKKKARI